MDLFARLYREARSKKRKNQDTDLYPGLNWDKWQELRQRRKNKQKNTLN